jgi:hypothetical protein
MACAAAVVDHIRAGKIDRCWREAFHQNVSFVSVNLASDLQPKILLFPRVFRVPIRLWSGTFVWLCSAATGERSAGSGSSFFATTGAHLTHRRLPRRHSPFSISPGAARLRTAFALPAKSRRPVRALSSALD